MADFFYSTLIIVIFYATFLHIVTGLLFMRMRSSRSAVVLALCCNSLVILIMFLPYFLQYYGLFNFYSIPLVTSVAEIIYPAFFTVLVSMYSFSNTLRKNYPIILLSVTGLVLYLAIPGDSPVIKLAVIMVQYIYVLHVLVRSHLNLTLRLIFAFVIINLVYLITGFFNNPEIHFLISPGCLSLLIFYLIVSDYVSRIDTLAEQISKSTSENRRLNHHIHRLKGSIEQYRRLMIEKDLELYQIARHASLAEITTGIGHELTQPLTGIKGIAQNMIDDINYYEFDTLQGVSELMRICSLVDKSSSIINHIRNFSRKGGFSKKSVDLNSVILSAIDLINMQLKKNNIDIVFVLDESIPHIYGDCISLEQLVINIILNARDAIADKQAADKSFIGLIRVTTSTSENHIRMSIEDNGPGIPDEIMPKIWSPFFTSKKKKHGTGIGLSICNRILKDHNAEVLLNSSQDGTSFIFDFPLHYEKIPDTSD